ncbi:sensor histidine kinase [Nonomuraea sp. NPDC050663]|uniref:sensor histidine kinase n=1 Tax=Nonomuraea sp. NPDC050663 TaxID=3364370 RepID=UPI0037ACE6B7
MRRTPAVVAAALVVLGVLATTVRLDTPSDGSTVRLGWHAQGVTVEVPDPSGGPWLATGDLVTGVAGRPLSEAPGTIEPPREGRVVPYDVIRDGSRTVAVRIGRSDPSPLLLQGWGNLVFVLALAALAVALRLRRPEEPATAPLLVFASGLLGSTITVAAGLPALTLATGGPYLWLFHLNAIVAYSISWGGLLAFVIVFTARRPLSRRTRRAARLAYGGPPAAMALWSAFATLLAPHPVAWLGLVHTGQTAVVALSLVIGMTWGYLTFRGNPDPAMRARMRWMLGGGVVSSLLAISGWHLPELVAGAQALPWGAMGLSGLPFVAGIGIALRRHRLFDIERLANRSLVYSVVVACLVAGYAAMVTLLVSGLRLSQTAAAGLAAAGAALALAPLRGLAQSTVNRMMYGDRHDPAGALARLGTRLQAVLLPGDVLPAIVETVARSLRVPYAAIDLADGSGTLRQAAQHGVPAGQVHDEPLRHHGELIGRLRVSARGHDDPLEPIDVRLIGSLAQQVGTAVQAVRLHEDLVRSRAEVVASREAERRRLRRDLHDGLGPTLAAIGLKSGLARRAVPAQSPARRLLDEVCAEASASIDDVRRLVEALRPPALDELGVVGAVRARAQALAVELDVEVTGPEPMPALPAAVEAAAYGIAVEAVTNAVRHSGGTRCEVRITLVGGDLEVLVTDDGHGLRPRRTPGVGLHSMRERAAEVAGTWSMASAPGGGTAVRALLPARQEGHDDQPDPRR